MEDKSQDFTEPLPETLTAIYFLLRNNQGHLGSIPTPIKTTLTAFWHPYCGCSVAGRTQVVQEASESRASAQDAEVSASTSGASTTYDKINVKEMTPDLP